MGEQCQAGRVEFPSPSKVPSHSGQLTEIIECDGDIARISCFARQLQGLLPQPLCLVSILLDMGDDTKRDKRPREHGGSLQFPIERHGFAQHLLCLRDIALMTKDVPKTSEDAGTLQCPFFTNRFAGHFQPSPSLGKVATADPETPERSSGTRP